MNNLSLYQLGTEYQSLLSQLYDHETGEVNEEVDAQLNALSTTTEEKCIAVTSWIKRLESDQNQLEKMVEEILSRGLAFTKEINKWKDYLKTNMERCQITEVKCPYFTLKIKKNPYSTDIFDEAQIPERFMRTREIVKVERKADKNAIKEEVLNTGIQIPGAIVQQNTKLQILTDKI